MSGLVVWYDDITGKRQQQPMPMAEALEPRRLGKMPLPGGTKMVSTCWIRVNKGAAVVLGLWMVSSDDFLQLPATMDAWPEYRRIADVRAAVAMSNPMAISTPPRSSAAGTSYRVYRVDHREINNVITRQAVQNGDVDEDTLGWLRTRTDVSQYKNGCYAVRQGQRLLLFENVPLPTLWESNSIDAALFGALAAHFQPQPPKDTNKRQRTEDGPVLRPSV